MRFRQSIADFQLANPMYVGASVLFYETEITGARSSRLATLYAQAIGAMTLNNPQVLDSEGKFARPVYIDRPVVAVVTGATVASHETGVIAPRGTYKGEWEPNTIYFTGDVVRQQVSPGVAGLYVVSNDYMSRATLADDMASGDLLYILDSQGYIDLFNETESLRDQVRDGFIPQISTMAADALLSADAAGASAGQAFNSREAALASASRAAMWAAHPVGVPVPESGGFFSALHYQTRAQEAFAGVQGLYAGARSTVPPGANVGTSYLDTSVIPNRWMVLTAQGWQPSSTVSVGGIRSEDFPMQNYASGTRLPVAGGFTSGDVYIDGRLIRSGADVTLEPGTQGGQGNILLNRQIAPTERLSFRGYVANPASEFLTQLDAAATYATRSSVQELLGIFPGLSQALSGRYMRINASGTAWETRTPAQTRGDIGAASLADANTFAAAQTVPNLIVAGNLMQFLHANGQRRYVHHDGTYIGFLGNDGAWKARVSDDGSFWTAQLGDLNARIEARAAAHAQSWAATRLPLTGGDVSGDIRLISGGPTLMLHRSGIREWGIHVLADAMLAFWDRSSGAITHQFHPDGNIWSVNRGWVWDHIATRAQLYDSHEVQVRTGRSFGFIGDHTRLRFLTRVESGSVPRLFYETDYAAVWRRIANDGVLSDERTKDIHGRVMEGEAGSIIDRLAPIVYEFKEGDGPEGRRIGFSAQALQEIMPTAVRQGDEELEKGLLFIENDAAVQLLAIAVTELQSVRARLDRLEQRSH